MLSFSKSLSTLGLLIASVKGSLDDNIDPALPYRNESTIIDAVCTENVTVTDTTTVLSSVIVPVTEWVDTTVFQYVNVTVNSTETNIETSTIVTCITESTTSTLYFTVSNTETDLVTVTDTDTATTTATVPATITTYTTETITDTTYDPCPSTCSVSAATVTLFYWPSDRPFSYPSTYVHPDRDYTFTSPSVYMLIPTIVGTNSAGTVGPSSTDWILELDLEEVSTIADGSITQQLTLSHLGTDCPQSMDPTAIATLSDSRCAPILAAPSEVSSWASPCNACGPFGLFDPPYAIPTVTGGILGPSTADEEEPPAETTDDEPAPTEPAPTEPAPTEQPDEPLPTEEPEGVVLVVTYSDGTPIGTGTMTSTGMSGTQTSSVDVPVSTEPVTETTISGLPSSTTPPPVTAPAARVTGGASWALFTSLLAVLLLH